MPSACPWDCCISRRLHGQTNTIPITGSGDFPKVFNLMKWNLVTDFASFLLKVTAEALQDETPPWKFRKIHIRYEVIGTGIDPEKAKKAVQLSEEKYCAVYATLRDVVEITHEIEVLEH